MADFFEALLNMSITGSVVIAVVILMRFLLRGMPKKYSYFLWGIAGFRLCCPFSFKSIVSIFNINPVQQPSEIVTKSGTMNYIGTPIAVGPSVNQGIPNDAIGGADGPTNVYVASNAFDIFLDFIPYIWLGVFLLFAAYALISFIRLKKSLATATKYDGNIYQSDAVSSPFIIGIFKPEIYIPYGVDEGYFEYVIAHERYHIRRGDNIIKVISFLILAVHWFNPLCWLAFSLMSRDMEMSCDEWVLAHNDNIKKEYSSALLSFATDRKMPSPSPLCFGEGSAKSRIKNILKFRKPTLIMSVLAIILCAAIAIVCIANPKGDNSIAGNNATAAGNAIYSGDDGYVDLSDIADMNIGAGMPTILYADESKVIFEGTCGVVQFDYSSGVVTDRLSISEILKLDLSEYYDRAVSEDGERLYLINNEFEGDERNAYCYDFTKREINEIKPFELTGRVFTPELIDDEFNGKYSDYIDNSYLTGILGALVGNSLMYLRADNDWSMQSLQLVICDLKSETITKTIPVFSNVSDDLYDEQTAVLFSNLAGKSKMDDYSDVIAEVSSHNTKNKYYKALMEDKDRTIKYIFTEFSKGRQVNAKGTLMRLVTDDIIGGEAIKTKCDTAQEYFDSWVEHNEKLLIKNDNTFMEQNYPYGFMYLTQYANDKIKPEPAKLLNFFAYCCYDVSFPQSGETVLFEYDYDSSYEPKVLWRQNYCDPEVKEASLVVVDGNQEIYIRKLEIEDVRPYSYNNDKWDYVIELDSKVTAEVDLKLSSIPNLVVVIKDSNNMEYRIRLDRYMRDVDLAPVFVYDNGREIASYNLPE